jgi:DMSO/TMAO reductase YedYZ molybdopterin-dependent catalytic subunit
MPTTDELLRQHDQLTRRYFVGLGAAAMTGIALARPAEDLPPELAERVAGLEYLTPSAKFVNVSRGTPPPPTLSPEARREAGMHPDTWRLEVVPDPGTDAQVEAPLSKELGTALTWADLLRLGEERAVCYLHVMTCLNVGDPCGMGLWEGVPLRDVVWLAKPKANIRRVFYHGFHNNDPAQLFRSSLPFGRVLEDPPGQPPVLLCYRMNGAYLSPDRGGPVRIIVPDAYGFKSVKWVERIVLSNAFQANDTYAEWNNDIDTSLKTYARFLSHPKTARAGESIPLTGLAQVGVSGLSSVQVGLRRKDEAGDSYWTEAEVLGPPTRWGGEIGDGPLPGSPLGFDASGKPLVWPQPFTLAHWAALLPAHPPGEYELSCRTLDAAGHVQPMPRPFPKSGNNAVHTVGLVVEGA